jgi:hypothetical protein
LATVFLTTGFVSTFFSAFGAAATTFFVGSAAFFVVPAIAISFVENVVDANTKP